MDIVTRSIVVGIIATGLMDVWAMALARFAGIPPTNWGIVGRWFAHLPRGRFVHADIGASEQVANEKAIGWAAHYIIGIVYAWALLVIAGPAWRAAPTLLPALLIAWITVGAGWFILQPGLGLGIAASKRANANQIRMLNVIGHTVFGLGLFIGTVLTR
jgi:hypothetical protein